MIFVKVNKEYEIEQVHYLPFDPVHGFGKTEEELLKEGLLVESLPEPELISGKNAMLRYDGSDFYFEYEDIPLTSEQQIELLKVQNSQMLFALVEGGLL
ncbi:hypothetical protein M3603_08465 [Rummeliibacillus stabekisii]|uniref:hypothetical protein n=1 Tax=Rummeliibacillus stabekisii TaxID=241244 RepID=UPI00203F5298|nr:hypothetical protein [Rummeliibacillus stabekisii]MCM3316710.1 hypothetical protein [Rummeliibacillus stabekisii]